MTTPAITRLSDREIEILRLVATGASNKEIARELKISPNTVKVHLRNIFSKIGVLSRTEAAMYAVRKGYADANASNPNQQTILEDNKQTSIIDWVRTNRLVFVSGIILLLIMIVVISFQLRRRGPPLRIEETETTLTVESRWSRLANLPTPRSELAAAIYNNMVYTISGNSVDGASGVVEKYDPNSDNWTILLSKSVPVYDMSAAVLGEKIIVPGGRISSNKATDIMEVFDPRNNTWEKSSNLPTPRSAYGLVSFEGMLYLFGGTDGKNYVNTVLEYDPSEPGWREISLMQFGCFACNAVVNEGKIYVFEDPGVPSPNKIFNFYPKRANLGEASWELANTLPERLDNLKSTSIASTIYVFCESEDGTSKMYGLLPVSKQWIEIDDIPINFPSRLTPVAFDTDILFFGGTKGNLIQDSLIGYKAIYKLLIPHTEK